MEASVATVPARGGTSTRVTVVCGSRTLIVMITLDGSSGLRDLGQLGHQLTGLAVVGRAWIERGAWSHMACCLIIAALLGRALLLPACQAAAALVVVLLIHGQWTLFEKHEGRSCQAGACLTVCRTISRYSLLWLAGSRYLVCGFDFWWTLELPFCGL